MSEVEGNKQCGKRIKVILSWKHHCKLSHALYVPEGRVSGFAENGTRTQCSIIRIVQALFIQFGEEIHGRGRGKARRRMIFFL